MRLKLLPKSNHIVCSRRSFLLGALTTTAGSILPGVGCLKTTLKNTQRFTRNGPQSFPVLEVSGSTYEIGRAIGKCFAKQIKTGLARREKWFNGLRDFVEQDQYSHYRVFVEAAEKFFPDIFAELQGWADGAQIAFKDLMILNLKAELEAMMKRRQPTSFGCSTLAWVDKTGLLLAHNEDGDRAYADLMFLVKVTQPNKPSFLCLTYPGILPGNGPAANDAGLILTTNFIAGSRVRPGIPRYFLSRAMLSARSLKEAVSIATHPNRAYSFHYNLGSSVEKRILSVETSPDQHQIRQINGLYIHTNHFVLSKMKQIAQDKDYVTSSSQSRYQVLENQIKNMHNHLDQAKHEILAQMLSSHQKAPYSPCRHPTQDVRGITLAQSVFNLLEDSWTLTYNNPCRNLPQAIPLGWAS